MPSANPELGKSRRLIVHPVATHCQAVLISLLVGSERSEQLRNSEPHSKIEENRKSTRPAGCQGGARVGTGRIVFVEQVPDFSHHRDEPVQSNSPEQIEAGMPRSRHFRRTGPVVTIKQGRSKLDLALSEMNFDTCRPTLRGGISARASPSSASPGPTELLLSDSSLRSRRNATRLRLHGSEPRRDCGRKTCLARFQSARSGQRVVSVKVDSDSDRLAAVASGKIILELVSGSRRGFPVIRPLPLKP